MWKRLQPLCLGLLFLGAGLALLLQRDVYQGERGAMRLDM